MLDSFGREVENFCQIGSIRWHTPSPAAAEVRWRHIACDIIDSPIDTPTPDEQRLAADGCRVANSDR